MALNAAEIAKISKVAITSYGKNKPIDQINVERPLLDILVPKAKDLVGGVDGFTINVFKSNDANGQYWTGNGRVTYNTRNPNDFAKYDWANFHDGFVLNEDELFRAGIQVNDDIGKSTATKGEVVQLTNMLESQFTALEEGAKDFHHAALWLDGSQYTDARPGIDALVSTTPSSGTMEVLQHPILGGKTLHVQAWALLKLHCLMHLSKQNVIFNVKKAASHIFSAVALSMMPCVMRC